MHTGDGCIAHAGHIEGDGFSAQANMMASPEVWPAMAAAFEAADGPLARRLLAALEAAEAAGGDVRGRQSAALLVVPGEGEGWETNGRAAGRGLAGPARRARPPARPPRRLRARRPRRRARRRGQHAEAAELYARAAAAAPDNLELAFWAGLGIAASGDVDAGAERVAGVIAADRRWGELLARLDPELAPGAPAVRERLGLS